MTHKCYAILYLNNFRKSFIKVFTKNAYLKTSRQSEMLITNIWPIISCVMSLSVKSQCQNFRLKNSERAYNRDHSVWQMSKKIVSNKFRVKWSKEQFWKSVNLVRLRTCLKLWKYFKMGVVHNFHCFLTSSW